METDASFSLLLPSWPGNLCLSVFVVTAIYHYYNNLQYSSFTSSDEAQGLVLVFCLVQWIVGFLWLAIDHSVVSDRVKRVQKRFEGKASSHELAVQEDAPKCLVFSDYDHYHFARGGYAIAVGLIRLPENKGVGLVWSCEGSPAVGTITIVRVRNGDHETTVHQSSKGRGCFVDVLNSHTSQIHLPL